MATLSLLLSILVDAIVVVTASSIKTITATYIPSFPHHVTLGYGPYRWPAPGRVPAEHPRIFCSRVLIAPKQVPLLAVRESEILVHFLASVTVKIHLSSIVCRLDDVATV